MEAGVIHDGNAEMSNSRVQNVDPQAGFYIQSEFKTKWSTMLDWTV